ncbi:E3 ubiquitin-protein ligase Iruka [Musca vetustissima]|uniref:E3 ubiquitin-protein ligase Iruka n=1 Tax=Musca vetustissima TaxID=27455 RepID=UPI002AB78FE1|nr:E3 ubiquitin-protein ligase Iruka [Musca vetustissima]
MAEAVVEERPPVQPRFYCHKCDEEINISNTDYTCPICSGGFVEELPPAAANAAPSNAGGGGGGSGSSGSNNAGFNNDELQLEALRGQIANLLASRNGPNLEININPGALSRPPRGIVSLGPSVTTGGGRVRPQSLGLDNVLLDFLQSISVGGGGGGADGEMNPFDNSQFLFMGNLGDYAWGREGLDTIVTQLLNQMETSGPPPLAKDKIDEIPKVEITPEEIERKLQCSVCWEDFKIQEMVRKLPCSHVYHEECIVPWLKLHGTCPICRKSLNGEEEEDNDVHMDVVEDQHQSTSASSTATSTAAGNSSTCPIHQQQSGTASSSHQYRNHQDGQPGTSSSSNSASSASSQQQQQQQQRSNPTSDNIFGFERMDSVDLD